MYPLPFERTRHYGVLSRCEDCRKVGDVSFTWAKGFCMCFLHTQHDKLGRSRSPTMHCILLVLLSRGGRQGHVISKIADAITRGSMAFCIHFLEASSALERQANHFFSLPICSCLIKVLFQLRGPVKAHF